MHIITIDGPASSGKGTVAKLVAAKLGFHYLDSGAIYRALGLVLLEAKADKDDKGTILELVDKMKLTFIKGQILINNQDKTKYLREENVGMIASYIAKIPEVRARLLDFQRSFAVEPGLVTDGRDMGSIVFPKANLKIFLTASAEKRASRRYSQLHEQDNSVTIRAILRDIHHRDKQDSERSVAPLAYDSTFMVLDNSDLSIEETVETIINWYKK